MGQVVAVMVVALLNCKVSYDMARRGALFGTLDGLLITRRKHAESFYSL